MPEKRHRRTIFRVIIVAELVIALVTAATVVFAYNHLDSNIEAGPPIDHVNPHRPKASDEPHEPLNILLMGTDSRACAGCGVDNQAGGGVSDTTILLHVAADRKSAYAVSIPRDLLVDRPDCEIDGRTVPGASDVLWNDAFAEGGPACTVKQVESVFAPIYVDDYITIDFGGFQDMVDAIGGVDICIPQPLDDPDYTHTHFDAGSAVHLDGKESLAYVRLRHVLGGTDLGRIKRQQTFIAAMTNKLVSAGTLTRPDKLLRFANALTSSLQASPDLASASALVKLAGELKDADLANIKFVTMPNFLYPEGSAGYPHVGLLPAHRRLVTQIADDEPLGRFGGVLSADGPKKKPSEAQKAEAAAAGICA